MNPTVRFVCLLTVIIEFISVSGQAAHLRHGGHFKATVMRLRAQCDKLSEKRCELRIRATGESGQQHRRGSMSTRQA
ncbi:MAG: hypothetical protein NTY41_09045 [Proteobacteria bacterium]|nr:hypothetical protein [Pseudomonadota bacterium]